MTTLALITLAVLVLLAFCAIARAGDTDDRRRVDLQVAHDRRREAAEKHRLAEPILWDDGLDVGKLEVRHRIGTTNVREDDEGSAA